MKAGLSLQGLAAEIERRANAKKDFIANTKDMEMSNDNRLVVGDAVNTFDVNQIAHRQIAQHTDIPAAYYDKMRQEAPDLLANNVNRWFQKYPAVRMVRTLDHITRAFPSDRYRPLENEDLAEAVLPVIMDLDLAVMSSQITDTKMYIKVVDRKVERELAAIGGKFGDGQHKIVRCLSPALTVSNSEVCMGALSVQTGVHDSFCSNLATFSERSTRKYHVGGRFELGEEVYAMLSDDTRRKTDAALWGQIRDIVKAAFERAQFDALCDKISETASHQITGDPVKVVQLTAKRFGMNETEGKSVLRHLIEGADLSQFGLHNAITRASQDVEDYDRASDFERAGGQVIELPAAEWKELAKAE